MTLKELKENIATSPNKDWLQNYQLTINSPLNKYRQVLKGVVNIYEFIVTQAEGFSFLERLPDELDRQRERFINAKGTVLQLLSQNSTNNDNWDNNLKGILGANNQPVFIYNSPETEFLIRTFHEKPELYPAAYEYLIGSTSRPTTKTYLEG